MNKNDVRIKTSKRNFILALLLLLATNILMGLALVSLSKKTLKEQINQRMLDVANTASFQLEGDIVKQLTVQDKDTEEYNNALDTLRSFQENIDLDYIYTINP